MHNGYDSKGTLSQDTGGLVSDPASQSFPGSNTHTPPQTGTKLELVLKRGDETLKANVDLQAITIFAPQTNSPPSGLK